MLKKFFNHTPAIVLATLGTLSFSNPALSLETSEENYALKLLGQYLFFDKISFPTRQACASCHTPDAGWTNGTSGVNLKQVAVTGANPHTVGTLKPPMNAYAFMSPDFANTSLPFGLPQGGNFWNGRATGEIVANIPGVLDGFPEYAQYLGPTADQAHASPFINPVEQGRKDIADVCQFVSKAKYAPLYSIAFGGQAMDCGNGVELTFGRFAVALAAYQHSKDVNPFDSKRDRALAQDSDGQFPLDGFTEQENLGHDLFYNSAFGGNPKLPATNCALCHNNHGLGSRGTEPDQIYSDFSYHNIGVPRNIEIPGNPEPNIGVAATTGNLANTGLHKTPSLRNVDKRRGEGFKKAYTHNGWFKSIESLVHYYNTANVDGATAASFGITRCPNDIVTEKEALANNCWPVPEFGRDQSPALAIGILIGNMGMTAEQEAAIVAYIKTLTDIPTASAPAPFNLKKFNNGETF